ncbi:MAG: POTRA domain-containing protein, partial [Acidobacteriota bacterium]
MRSGIRRGRSSLGAWVCMLVFAAAGTLSAGTMLCEDAPTVRRIRLERENVFEDAESSFLARLADGLHAITRDEVILRELLFTEGAPLAPEKIAETERNLRRMPIFRSVQIRVEPVGPDEVDVVVRTRDSWTTQVTGSIGRDGGRGRFGLGLEENNLLGTG